MPAKTHGERLDRLEKVVAVLAEEHLSLERTVAELATEMRRGFDQVAATFQVIGKQMAQTSGQINQLAHQGDKRTRELDERVDKLVSAIGELVRRQDASKS